MSSNITSYKGVVIFKGSSDSSLNASIYLYGGSLWASGDIVGDIVNIGGLLTESFSYFLGDVAPGGPGEFASLFLKGTYFQRSGGQLTIEVATNSRKRLSAVYDEVKVSKAFLSGNIFVSTSWGQLASELQGTEEVDF